MKRLFSIALKILILSIVLAALSQYPRHETGSELKAFQNKLALLTSEKGKNSTIIPVMSFNLRFECSERDPSNNWANRTSRVKKVVQDYAPWVMGTQELFPSQAKQLASLLAPLGYKMINHERDTWTTIYYDANKLELIEWDHFWLSLTPRVENSKSWDSWMPRMVTTARFKILDNKSGAEELILFNTHLDHMGGEARIQQAKILKDAITEKRKEYPNAPIFLTGDFNTAPGQGAYQILTNEKTNTKDEIVLKDSFAECSEKEFTGLAATFHAWFGAVNHSYLVRLLLYPGFVGHAIYGQRNLENVLPTQSGRFHIDWILYSSPKDKNQLTSIPRFTSIVDVRYSEFSSDHFPIITLFELTK